MSKTSVRPGLIAYITILWVALIAVLVATLQDPIRFHDGDLIPWIALIALFIVVEQSDLNFHDERGRWGLSASEAVLLPMIVGFTFQQAVLGVILGLAIVRVVRWRSGLVKVAFNIASDGCAAAAAAAVWQVARQGSTFSVRNSAAAVIAVVTFALLTHLFVAGAQMVAAPGQGRLTVALKGIAPAALLNLAGNITLGLFFAAAYKAAHWTVFIFPVPLAALYFGFRAVLTQRQARQRIENLYEASRALASSGELEYALSNFLRSTANMVSAIGARAAIRIGDRLLWSSMYAGEPATELVQAEDPAFERLLEKLEADHSPLMIQENDTETRESLPKAFDAGSLVIVPVFDGQRAVIGCLIAADRVGADEFSDDDARLLVALANELTLTLESRRLTEEVSEERERFQLLVEAVEDYAIFLLHTDGRIASWNTGAERITGYSAEEISGKHASLFYPPDPGDASVAAAELERAYVEGRAEVDGWRVRKDGSRFLANEIITPVTDAAGHLRGFAKVTRDVTERARAQEERDSLEAQLHQAQKLESVGQLAGGIAHDFNNLLAVIINSARFVLDDLTGEEPYKEDVEEIRAAADRAATLTKQLLIFSRREVVQHEVVDLNSVVTDIEKLLRRAIGEQVRLETKLNPGVHPIKADVGQLEQVLLNLAINARDAMPGGGTIVIETAPAYIDEDFARSYVDLDPGDYVRLRVSDTGSGMPPSVIERAFDPFFTTKPKGMGTGLGLATVYGIVQNTHGHIKITSKEGVGTTFTIHLPVTEEDAALIAEEHSVDLQGGRGETILLVEDEDAVRAVARRILTDGGYQVTEARSGTEALAEIARRTEPFEVLLSDVVMPEMSGTELVERIAALRARPKVIYMSGYSESVFSPADLAEGATVLIQKPFTRAELLGTLRQVLDG
jgi:PAS domain S-box-containing protein